MAKIQRQREREENWVVDLITSLTGGINGSRLPDQIEDEETPNMKNVRIRDGKVEVDSGFSLLYPNIAVPPVLIKGAVQGIFDHQNNSGAITTLMVTTWTVYALNTVRNEFEMISNGLSQTTNSIFPKTPPFSDVDVDDGTEWAIGDLAGIRLDNGVLFTGEVTNITVNTITLLETPGVEIASSGAAIIQAKKLVGNPTTKQVIFQAVPAQEWTVITNGIDHPIRYDGTDIQDIPGLVVANTVCQSLGLFHDALILIGLTVGGTDKPRNILWSKLGDATSWTISSTSTAGEAFLSDTRDPLVAGGPLGEDFYLYGNKSVTRMEFLGQSDGVFGFFPVGFGRNVSPVGIGCVSQNALYIESDRHIFVSTNGIYLFTGGRTFQNISEKVYGKYFSFEGLVSRQHLNMIFHAYSPDLNELFFFYITPDRQASSNAIIINLGTGTWRFREFDRYSTAGPPAVKYAVGGFFCVGNHIAGNVFTPWSAEIGTWEDAVGPWVSAIGFNQVDTLWFGGSNIDWVAGSLAGAVWEYDLQLATDDGQAIDWFIETKDFEGYNVDQRLDSLILQHKGQVDSYVSVDRGVTWELIDSSDNEAVFLQSRMNKQITGQRLRFKFQGTGRSGELGAFAWKHREESIHGA